MATGKTPYDRARVIRVSSSKQKAKIHVLFLNREILRAVAPVRAGTTTHRIFKVFRELTDPARPALTVAVINAANRFPPEIGADFNREVFENTEDPEIRAYAIHVLYRQSPERYKDIIAAWLGSESFKEKKAGVIAAGGSGDTAYIPVLKDMMAGEQDGLIISEILKSIYRLGAEGINDLVLPYLSHPLAPVRLAAMEALDINNDDTVRGVIPMLDDESDEIREKTKEKLVNASYQNIQLLVESLALPRRNIREGIFELLESLNIKDLDVIKFARAQLERSYRNMAEVEALHRLSESRERDLLMDHLKEKRTARLDNVLRVLAVQDRTGQMRVIWRGLSSANLRQRANSLEALEDSMDPSLGKIMVPLLEDSPMEQCLAIGRKNFQLPEFDRNEAKLYTHLLEKYDWVTVALTLFLSANQAQDGLDRSVMERLKQSGNDHIRYMAERIMKRETDDPFTEEASMEAEFSIPDKILHLRKIQIFAGLAVSELAAVASVTEEVDFPKGETVIRQGEPGDTMYLIVRGEVAVLKNIQEEDEEHEIELDRIKDGDYFGEMALFEDNVRSATIRTSEDCRFLVLHKREFTEIVREYPQIALHICKVLSNRLLRLHEKLRSSDK